MGKKKNSSKERAPNWSSESSDEEYEWVEKKVETKVKGPCMPPTDINLSELANEQEKEIAKTSDDWLGASDTATSESGALDFFSAFGIKHIKPNEERKKALNDELQRTQNERELNPYWKNGGSGLPNENAAKESQNVDKKTFGDGGLAWWTKALERCKQSAKDEGRSLESIAAERYGSLSSLLDKIEYAKELNATINTPAGSESSKKSSFAKPGHYHNEKNKYSRQSNDTNWRRRDANVKQTESRREEKYNRRSPSPTSSNNRYLKKKNETEPEKMIKRTRSSSSSSSSSSKSPSAIRNIKKPETNDGYKEIQSKTNDFDAKYANKDENELGAEIIKAELRGDEELANKLKKLIENVRNKKQSSKNSNLSKSESKREDLILIPMKTDRFGNEIPLSRKELEAQSGDSRKQKSKKNKKSDVYSKDGKRESYFADDNKYSLKDLIENEKQISVEDNNLMYTKIRPKVASKLNSDDLDDTILENSINQQLDGWSKIKVLADQKTKNSTLSNCEFCFENAKQHLIVSIGLKSYLCLPECISLVEGHCYIVPIQHFISSLMLDEDVWNEMQSFRKALVKMFRSKNQDCIFIEQFSNEKSFQHMFIECIPINNAASEVAPMYFKKALLESESEWAQNKQIVNLKEKGGLRRAIPKGLPYFAVNFGLDDGFAHVIENKNAFPQYFAKEIIGGIMDLDPYLWRKAKKEKFNDHCKKVIEFGKYWKAHDFNAPKK